MGKLLDSKVALVVVGFGALYLASRMLGKSLGDTAYEAVQTVNPLSKKNVVYRGLNAVGDVVDDGANDNSFSLGAWIYNATHEDEFRKIYGG